MGLESGSDARYKKSKDEFLKRIALQRDKKLRTFLITGFQAGYALGSNDAFELAMNEGNRFTRNVMLCAIMLILHRHFGFGAIRLNRVKDFINQEMCECIEQHEIEKAVEKECKIRMNLDDDGLGMGDLD